MESSRFEAITGQIFGFFESSFDIDASTSRTWVAVRKDLLAVTLNNAIADTSACVSLSGRSHPNIPSVKIPMPDGDGINCSSDRDCESKRTCSFSANHDERDCSACILSAPRICSPRVCAFGGCIGGGCTGGQCVQRGNDPLCEVAKATQNAIYVADANLRKADCDRLRAMETAGCQAEELGKRTLCEAGKATLNALRKTGNFANVDIDAIITTDNLNVCLRDFSMSPGLDNLALNLEATGSALADVNVKFTPLDIVGHLACQFPWQERQQFKAEIRESLIPVSSAVKISSSQDKATVNFAIEESTIRAKVTPGITEYLLKSPMMTVSCAGLNLIKPLAVTLTPFLPVLRGEIDQTVGKQDAKIEIPLPLLRVGDLDLRMTSRETSKALIISGH